MVLHCRCCGVREHLFLHHGQLYCLPCLPLEQLPLPQRVNLLRRRSQQWQEAFETRRPDLQKR